MPRKAYGQLKSFEMELGEPYRMQDEARITEWLRATFVQAEGFSIRAARTSLRFVLRINAHTTYINNDVGVTGSHGV